MDKNGLDLTKLTPEQRKLLEIRLQQEGLKADTITKTGYKDTRISPVNSADYPSGCYPATLAQKRIYILNQLESSAASYNITGTMMIRGRLDRRRIETTFQKLIQRHEILRTSFEMIAGELYQRVHPRVDFPLAYFQAAEPEIPRILDRFIQGFNLAKAPLIRVGIIELAEDRQMLIYDLSHIISDGISQEILVDEFIRTYEGQALPEIRIQYKDFAVWQNRLLQSEAIKKQEEYWMNQFSGEIPVLNLPIDYPRPAELDFKGEDYQFEISPELTARLRKLCKQHDVTLFMLLLAGYYTLLSRFTGQEDIIIGTPVAGRSHADAKNLIGIFLNNLALRNYPAPQKSFLEFLKEVREYSLNAYENQDYQFEMLMEKLNLGRDMSRTPLFDTVFDFQSSLNTTGSLAAKTGGLEFIPAEIPRKTAKYDITIDLYETETAIKFHCMFRTRLFKPSTIRYLMGEYVKLLEAIGADPGKRLKDYQIFRREFFPEERNQVFPAVAYEVFDSNLFETIGQRFEAQAVKYPNQWAVRDGARGYTYQQLNQAANRICRVISTAEPGKAVALLFGHEPEMAAGMLGALKSGIPYIALDPTYPAGRLNYMLEDAGARLILTNQSHLELAGKFSQPANLKIVNINAIDTQGSEENIQRQFKSEQTANSERPYGMEHAAYIMYTSGSTGKPKGVIQSHRNILKFIGTYTNLLHLNSSDRIALFTSYSHAVGVIDIMSALLNGATLYLYNLKTEGSMNRLSQWLRDEAITVYHSIPTVFRYWLDTGKETEAFPRLRLVVLGGEAVYPKDVELYRRYLDDQCLLVNLFGSSEVLIATAYLMDKRTDLNRATVPVGYSVDGVTASIIDGAGEETGIYGIGEIIYQSQYLALGYWGKPEQTRDVFSEAGAQGEWRYRSGDIGRLLPGGSLEFLGRKDDQVKIRGYRIELSEIESVLDNIPGIKKSVVICQKGENDNTLVAYYQTAGGIQIEGDEIREELAGKLPDYMVPTYYIFMNRLPLTPNGKIDRKALPELEQSGGVQREYEAPRDEMERKLCEIWEEILGVKRVGINDNFFELGGHSLNATNLITRIHKTFQVEVPLNEVFKNPKIKELASYLKTAKQSKFAAILPAQKRDYYPLSSAQKRMYILNQLEGSSTNYNTPDSTLIEGKLDREKLTATFRKLIERHETLRTSFVIVDGEPVQRVHDQVEFEIEYRELAGNGHDPSVQDPSIMETISRAIRPFDLSKAPLLRVTLIKLTEDRHIILYDIHHIISDDTTMYLITKEFSEIFNGRQLPELKIQYRDYVIWQNRLLSEGNSRKQEQYWLEIFKDEIPVLNFPTDYPRPALQSFEGDLFTFEIGPDLKKRLSAFTKETEATVFMVLLAVFNTLMMKYTGQEDLVAGSPIAGRPHPDLENIIGMFVNMLALRSRPEGAKTFQKFLGEVKEQALEAYQNQDYQFEELVERLGIKRDLSRNPLFDVVLVMQTTGRWEIESEGVKLKPYRFKHRISKFDLMMSAIEGTDSIPISIEYCTRLFRQETISRIAAHFIKILEAVVSNQGVRLAEIEILTEAEKEKILYSFNDTKGEYPRDKTIHQLFMEQAGRTPEKIAVAHEGRQLTYQELNAKSNQLAALLRKKGAQPQDIVGIMLERSLEMIIGILGILKAGGAYLPIDTGYPEERIKYMIGDSKTKLIVTTQKFRQVLETNCPWLDIEDSGFEQTPVENLENQSAPEHLAYVIYTSGSTGNPKGTLIPHRGVVNYITWAEKMYVRGETLAFPLYSSLSFDLTVTSIFTPLISGNKIIVYGGSNQEFPIQKILEEDKVGILKLTPTHLQLIKELGLKSNHLRRIIVGGEDLKTALAKDIHELWGGRVEIFNEYGPTETTVGCMIYKYNPAKDLRNSVPIGAPAQNVQIYLLDKYLRPVAPGVVGEIYISGDGLARGYLGRQDLTEERFIPNPFIQGARMYRTGDQARMLPDGNIEYTGRIDHQVKIKGFRIEMGEIESRLLHHPAIEAVVVDVKENRRKPKTAENELSCIACGLPASYPGTSFDLNGVCNMCRDYREYKSKADLYFKTPDELVRLFKTGAGKTKSQYDCMVLFSGGKDSSYVLYQLVDMGLKVLAFTLDNGYISETALQNIQSIVDELKIDNVVLRPENMNRIFAESLRAESNVCNGCFKALLALSTKMAYEKGIKFIVTGLSRGQIYEMRLTALFNEKIFDTAKIDQAVLTARKLYHGMDDYISRLLQAGLLKDEAVFDQIEFIDFYRYSDVTKTVIYEFLKQRSAIWSKPEDTGWCSSNCRINDAGIYIHCKERGYHNYALPTCWEVRTGHLTLEEGRKTLNGAVQVEQVRAILNEIGYDENSKGYGAVEKYLVAYYVAAHKLADFELREYLKKDLPDYLIPAYFIQLNQFPVTANGKIDRKALPNPDSSLNPKVEYHAPTNEIEAELVSLWQGVLEAGVIGIDDNFFEIGGHSLKAIILISRIHKLFKVELQLNEIFQAPTIRKLARRIQSAGESIYAAIEPAPDRDYYPVSSAQNRIYVTYQLDPIQTNYNIPMALLMEGDFKPARFEAALRELIKRHESLRTSFTIIDGQPVQQVHPAVDFQPRYFQAKDGQVQVIIEQFIKPFDLKAAPLLRVGLIRISDLKQIIILDIHHIISDGISMQLLMRDFISLYNGMNVPAPRIQYKDFSIWQNQMLKSDRMKREEEYWLNKLSGKLPVLNLPTDYPRPAVQSLEGAALKFTATRELTAKIARLGAATGTTTYMILLAAYNILLSKYANQEDILIGSPVAGRPHVDLENIIGMFINPLVMRNYPALEKQVGVFLTEVKENSLGAFENQDYPVDHLLAKLNLPKDPSRTPLTGAGFVLQNTNIFNLGAIMGLQFQPYEISRKGVKTDLNLIGIETGGVIDFLLEYSVKLFTRETIERMGRDYLKILDTMIDGQGIKIKEIKLAIEFPKYKPAIVEDFEFKF